MIERIRFHYLSRKTRWTEQAAMKVAWLLPESVVMWCYVRVGAHATTGQYSDTVVPELSMVDGLRRWGK